MKRIFITGASGCIGHYLSETLIQNTNHELYLLVRNPDKLQFDYQARPGIHLLVGNLTQIEEYGDLLFNQIDTAILAATAWGGKAETYEINVIKTLALINLLNPKLCERVIYFSTASILDQNNQLLTAAKQFGHDYIKTKYQCFEQLAQQKIADKIIAVFPTLVFGGDQDKPYSHLSAGITDVTKWIGLIRWFSLDGSFHFIHAQDIATVVSYLVDNPDYPPASQPIECLVLGNPAISVDQAIAEITHYFHKKVYLRIPLYIWLTNIFIKVFRIQMDDWSRFSLDYRHFTYTNPVNPARLGMTNYCANVQELMQVSRLV